MFAKKGQGSLEYLLLIGGAVLVAAIVIALVVSSSSAGTDVTKCNTAKSLCVSKYPTNGTAANQCPTTKDTTHTVSIQGTAFYCGWYSNNCSAFTSTTATTPC